MTTEVSKEAPLLRLFRYAGSYKGRIYQAGAFSVLNKIFDLAPPILIGAAIDVVVNQEDSLIAGLGFPELMVQLWILVGITVFVWAMESLFQFLYQIWWRNLAQDLQHDLRMDCYEHLQKLDMKDFENESTGGFMSILNDDINQLERFLDGGANSLLQVATTVTVIGAIYLYYSPLLTLVSFLPVPIILIGSFYYQKKILHRYADVREKVADLNAHLANNIAGISTIKSFHTERHEAETIREKSRDYAEANRKAIFLSSAFIPLIRMAILIGFSATLLIGGNLTLKGQISVGAYSVLVFLTQRLLWPLTGLGQTFDLYQRAMASVERTLELLHRDVEISEGERELPEPVNGEISYRNVTFSYQGREPVLEKISLEVEAGKTYGFVGLTGAGKSTFFKLLLRYYDPQSGKIAIDGVNIRDLSFESLRGNIGYVGQDVYLFPGTVRENLEYGRMDATLEETEEAARLAECSSFIGELPEGYDTVIGERGQKLSGGQRQRISLARAILKDPPILLLDEATSHVDNETEALIQKALDVISKDRTTLIIAHRLSTVRHAHQIFVLADKVIAESGTHEELIEKDGIYADLWRVQEGIRLV